MARKSRGSRVGKKLTRSAQVGAEDGAKKAFYTIAFGAAFAGVLWLWNALKSS